MDDAGGEFRLAHEAPVETRREGRFGVGDLERHAPMEASVDRLVDGREASAAHLAQKRESPHARPGGPAGPLQGVAVLGAGLVEEQK
jgi:hypothetical protein